MLSGAENVVIKQDRITDPGENPDGDAVAKKICVFGIACDTCDACVQQRIEKKENFQWQHHGRIAVETCPRCGQPITTSDTAPQCNRCWTTTGVLARDNFCRARPEEAEVDGGEETTDRFLDDGRFARR